MNRSGKIAESWLNGLTDVDKTRFIAQAIGSAEYQKFVKMHELHNIVNMPFNFLKSYTPWQLEVNASGGKKSLRFAQKPDADKLRVMDVWMPTGLFAPSRNGSFAPLGQDFQCTSVIRPFLMRRQEEILIHA